MDAIRQYITTIITAAMLCAVVSALLGKKGTIGALIKLICGVFLSLTIIRPVADVEIDNILTISLPYEKEAAEAVMTGERMMEDSLGAIIKTQTEAYILDKAEALGIMVSVEVTVGEGQPPVPTAVVIRGDVSPYAKGRLKAMIEEDLGITKENQLWTG